MDKMKNIYGILAAVFAMPALLSSCDGFLDPYPSAIRDEEYVLSSPNTMQGLIGQAYEYMSKNYNNNEGAWLDCATDNAVMTSPTDVIRRFSTGLASPTNDPFESYWERDWQGIYNVNLFLKDGNGRNLDYMLDDHLNELLKDRLWGEAYALRAWFQWDLLQKFGGTLRRRTTSRLSYSSRTCQGMGIRPGGHTEHKFRTQYLRGMRGADNQRLRLCLQISSDSAQGFPREQPG